MRSTPINRKQASQILTQIGEEYDCDAKMMLDNYSFFISEKGKVYIINNSVKDIDLSNVRINSLGSYFCELNKGQIRLSIEGSQIIGPLAKKNIVEIDDDTARLWLKGEEIDSTEESPGFVIIKNNNDYLGSGKYKEGRLLNYVSKVRRIRATD